MSTNKSNIDSLILKLQRTSNLLSIIGCFFYLTAILGLFYSNHIKAEKIKVLEFELENKDTAIVNKVSIIHDTIDFHETIPKIVKIYKTTILHDTSIIYCNSVIHDTVLQFIYKRDSTIVTEKIFTHHDTIILHDTILKNIGYKDSLNVFSRSEIAQKELDSLSNRLKDIKSQLNDILRFNIESNTQLLEFEKKLSLSKNKSTYLQQLRTIRDNVLNKKTISSKITSDKELLNKYQKE